MFDEGQHPRAPDGKFGQGSGGGAKKVAARAGASRALRSKATAAAGARVSKPISKRAEIDKAYVHVVRGEHAKAHAIFEKHGEPIQSNVMAMGKAQGYDYGKPPAAAPKGSSAPKAGPTKTPVEPAKPVAHAPALAHKSAPPPEPKSDEAGPAQSKPVVTPELRDVVANRSSLGNVSYDDAKGHMTYTPEAQAAVRGHFDSVAAKYGVTKRALPEGNKIDIVNERAMGGAQAQFSDDGGIRYPSYTAQMLRTHSEANLSKPPPYFTDAVQAYHNVTHETMHGHGPQIPYQGHGIMADELATEVTARRISADVHGIKADADGLLYNGGGAVGRVKSLGGYPKEVDEVTNAIAHVSGSDHESAYAALERAAFDVKRMPPTHAFATGDEAMAHLAKQVALHSGIKDPKQVELLHGYMIQASNDLMDRRSRRKVASE